MRIGIDASRAVTGQKTGTERYALALISHLIPAALARGHRLILYTNQPADARTPFLENPAIDYRPIPFPRLWTHIRLAAELNRDRPDLFFTPAHVIPLTYFGPSMATIHDLGYRIYPETHPVGQRLNLEWSTRHNAKRSKIVLADSYATKTDLVKHYRIDPAKIEVVYPGLDRDFVEEAEALPPHARSRPYLLFLSTLHPRKNIGRIIEAFRMVADSIPHDLILAGKKGWLTEQFSEQLAQLPPAIAQRVITPGFIPDEEKIGLIKGADLFLYPSLYEGFGFPLLEANACGTPVITADNSSLTELGSGGAAFFIDGQQTDALAGSIIDLLGDKEKRDALVAAGYKNISRFSWKKAAETVLDLSERVARASG